MTIRNAWNHSNVIPNADGNRLMFQGHTCGVVYLTYKKDLEFLIKPMYFEFWITLFLAFTVNCAPMEPKIMNGTEVEPFKYPWLTSVQFLGIHFCGGVMIESKTMITAAHCAGINVGPFIKVLAHRHNLELKEEEKGMLFKVISKHNHPKYNARLDRFTHRVQNDIAVWKLEQIGGDEYDFPPELLSFDDGTYSALETRLKVAGWGSTYYRGKHSKILLETEVMVSSIEQCVETDSKMPKIQQEDMCAASKGFNICGADSGGPLFAEKEDGGIVLVGIAIYDNGCKPDSSVGVFAKIHNHLDWIKTQI